MALVQCKYIITKPNLKLLMFFCSLHSVQLHRRRHHHGIYIASTRVTTVDITPSDDESEWSRVRCHASSLFSSRTTIFSPSVLLPLFFRQRFYKCTNAHIMLLQHKYIRMCTCESKFYNTAHQGVYFFSLFFDVVHVNVHTVHGHGKDGNR